MVIQPAVLDANWFYFEKLCTSQQWRKLSTHQHLNLSSNPYWMHSLLSNTLQRNPPAGLFLLPFLIFFSAICLGHKLIRTVSLHRVFTHDRPPLRSAYHQNQRIYKFAILVWSGSLIPSRSLSGVFVCNFVGGLISCLCLMRHKQKAASRRPLTALAVNTVSVKREKPLTGCLLKSHCFYKLKPGMKLTARPPAAVWYLIAGR